MLADAANFGPGKVGYFDRWESGDCKYEASDRVADKRYEGAGLEELARRFV